MTQNDIKFEVEKKNLEIKDLMEHFDFTLNNKLNDLLEQIEDLQDECDHEFKDGKCVWCGKEKN